MFLPRTLTGSLLAAGLLCLGAPFAPAAETPAAPRTPRVLLLASAPTREFLFVRSLFTDKRESHGIEAAYYLQMRKPEAIGGEPAAPLARFPDHLGDSADDKPGAKPFNLASYDVLIAFDPDWSALKPEQLALVRKWVEAGAGLVVIAGPVNTPLLVAGARRRAASDALRSILDLYPVELDDYRLHTREADRPWRLHLAPGKPAPSFLQLDSQGKRPLTGWEEFFTGREQGEAKEAKELLRGFYNYYPVKSVKEGATVLATFADPKAKLPGGQEQPFLVTASAGKGRVVYIGSGELWRLRQFRVAFHKRFWTELAGYTSRGRPIDRKDSPAKSAKPALNALVLETEALQTLYHLHLSSEQLHLLAKVAPETAEPARERTEPKVGEDLREALLDLHDALVDANDGDRIEELEEKYDALAEATEPQLDTDVKVTAAARKRVAEVLRHVKPSQMAAYLTYLAEEVHDPLDILLTAVESVRSLNQEAWKERRDEISEEVGYLLGGIDTERAGRIRDQVVALLSKSRSLSEAEFKAQKGELEKTARQIHGDVAPEQVLRHTLEHTLAKLLSNPHLAAALEARLK